MKIRVLSKYRLRIQLIGVNLMIALLAIIIIGGGSYGLYYKQTVSYLNDTTDVYFSEVSEQLTDYYMDLYKLSDAAFYNTVFQEMVIGEDINHEEYRIFDRLMSQYVLLEDSVLDIHFISTVNNNDYFLKEVSDIYKFRNTLMKNSSFHQLDGSKLYLMSLLMKNKKYFYAVRPVICFLPEYDLYMKKIGVGIITLKKENILKILKNSNLPVSTETYLIDDKNNIIESTNELAGQHYNIDAIKGDYIVKSKYLDISPPMQLVCLIPKSNLYRGIENYKNYVLMTIIIMFIITLIGSISFNYRLTRPLKALADTFDRVAKGNLKSRLKFDYENEITTIEQNFNNMMNDIYTLNKNIMRNQERLYEVELDKKQFQYTSLQNQIKSHFLYNTLNMIRGMAHRGEKREMSELINKLVAYLRYTAREEQYVSIKEELEHLKNYMYIQETRFDKVIRLRKDMDKELLGIPILKLILQPLIENAASHGFNNWNKPGIITIKAVKKSKKVLIKVMDNGCGLSPEKLREVRAMLQIANKEINHIGLQNIQRRLQLEYGADCVLRIKSWEDIGTILSFEIPYIDDEKREEVAYVESIVN